MTWTKDQERHRMASRSIRSKMGTRSLPPLDPRVFAVQVIEKQTSSQEMLKSDELPVPAPVNEYIHTVMTNSGMDAEMNEDGTITAYLTEEQYSELKTLLTALGVSALSVASVVSRERKARGRQKTIQTRTERARLTSKQMQNFEKRLQMTAKQERLTKAQIQKVIRQTRIMNKNAQLTTEAAANAAKRGHLTVKEARIVSGQIQKAGVTSTKVSQGARNKVHINTARMTNAERARVQKRLTNVAWMKHRRGVRRRRGVAVGLIPGDMNLADVVYLPINQVVTATGTRAIG